MLEFVGWKNTFDHQHGPLFIDENFANIRGPGEAIGIHSGNPEGIQRNHYRYQDGKFHCSQVNICSECFVFCQMHCKVFLRIEASTAYATLNLFI